MNNRGLSGDNEWKQVSIVMYIKKIAKQIAFGGLFPGEGTAWFDDFEFYINGEKYIEK